MSTHKCLDGILRETKLLESLDFNSYDIVVEASVTHGHGVASKASSKYPEGTIQLQYPHFKAMGLDLAEFFPGTLNLSIEPKRCQIHSPSYELRNVDWYPPRGQTEDFIFCDCAIGVGEFFIKGYVYLPDPKTKIENYDREDVLQILSPHIPNLQDDQVVMVYLKSSQCSVK